MIDFYNLIDSNNENSFNEYTKGYIKQISLESFEVSEYIIESSNSGFSKIFEKVKAFFRKIKEFVKKWWNKLLKFLGLKDDTDEESNVDITEKANKDAEERIEEVGKEIEKDIDDISKKTEEAKQRVENIKKRKEEKFKKLYEKYFTKDKDKFDEIKNRIDRYIENGLPIEVSNKIDNFESRKYNRILKISFGGESKFKSLFKSDEDRINFYRDAIFKKYDEIEFKELDILKLYTDVKNANEYLDEKTDSINKIYEIITGTIINSRDDISTVLRNIRASINDDGTLDPDVKTAISNKEDYYFNTNSSSNILYIISYLQEISKLRIVRKSAISRCNELHDAGSTILKCFEQLNAKIDASDTGMLNSLNMTLNTFSNYEANLTREFMNIVNHFGKLENRIGDIAVEGIDDLQDKIKEYPELTDEEKLDVLEKINFTI